MFLKNLDLTTALRPSYLPDEVLLFVQDNVGLYEGYVPINFNGKTLLGRQLTSYLQEIQDPKLSKWTCLLDIPSNLLC
jgi:ESCRT-II complex subunit VPS36